MSYKLCIAEKPSVAKDIATVIGATKRENGYFEGKGYRVTWAVGHLVGLEEPEAYGYISKAEMWDKTNPQNKQTALSELPLFPDTFKTKVLENTKEQFNIVKALMLDNDCELVINCGDFGAEGHILQWFIREKVGCTKPELRFCATSMTEEAILDAMAHLRDAKEFLPIIRAEYCKKKADWIMGMSMSRCASIIYGARVDVGRVQSPTLYFVVKRYLEVKNFKAIDFYSFKAKMDGGFFVKWDKDTMNQMPSNVVDSEHRLIDKQFAEKTANDIRQGKCGKVVSFETKGRATDRPQLYDITELERDGNRLFGYSADQVLNTAQSLYEKHKVTTYPRTDSRYITHDIVPYLDARVRGIGKHAEYSDVANLVLTNGLNVDAKIVDDSKVTDHHAIIVTNKIDDFDFSVLTEIEKNILNLVIARILVALSGKYKYKETTLKIGFDNGLIFNASGRVPVDKGWKKIQEILVGKEEVDDEDKEKEEEQIFPPLQVGQIIPLDSVEVLARKTTPPKLHTEATLLTAMENAGAVIENGAILKGRGIGTQATRASIIKTLFDKGYVGNEGKGKTKYIIPTQYGLNVIKVLPEDLYSPKITADWETMISAIVEGKMTEDDFMNNFRAFILKMLDIVKNHKVENVDFSQTREAVCKCLWCQKPMYAGKWKKDDRVIKGIYCSNKECKFGIYSNDREFLFRVKKEMTEAQMKKIATQGYIDVKMKSQTNKEYEGRLTVEKNEKGYPALKFGFPPKDTKKKKPNSSISKYKNMI